MNFGELFKYPFIAEVWGTAFDFLMLIATIVTLYYIFRTLKAQNRAIELQQIALNNQRFEIGTIKLSLRPYLEVKYRESPSFGYSTTNSCELTLTVINADIYDLNFSEIANDGCNIFPSLPTASENHVEGYMIKTTIHFGNQVSFEMRFKDSIGTTYCQHATFYKNAHCHIEPPKEIVI